MGVAEKGHAHVTCRPLATGSANGSSSVTKEETYGAEKATSQPDSPLTETSSKLSELLEGDGDDEEWGEVGRVCIGSWY